MSHLLYFLSAHGFMIVPLAIVLMLIVLAIWRKKHAIASRFLAVSLVVFAIVNLIWGGTWNASYVHKHGVRGEAVVTKIVPTNSYINEVQVMEYHCLLRTESGKVIAVSFENNGDIFYPQTDLWMPPAIGESFTVRYMEGHEENFIIPTDDKKSPYASKLHCIKMLEVITSAKAAYEFDRKNTANKKAYEKLLRQFLQMDCDPNLRTVYQMELDKLR